MPDIIIDLIKQLQPVVGLLVVVLLFAVVFLARDNTKLRDQRNEAVAKKDEELRKVADRKDQELKEINNKMLEVHVANMQSNTEVANAVLALKNESETRSKIEEIRLQNESRRQEADERRSEEIVKTMQSIRDVLIKSSG